ncbi:MAG: hypothetical protein HY393_01470 [Candidatus Diapherotrites archaeon]|nr:hypothetical protein [Candidatus Diapherotrites archaeon]
MKQTRLFPVIGVMALLVLAGCAQTGSTSQQTPTPANPASASMSATVNITSNGYDPQSVTVKKGGTVTWVNTADSPNWPASAVHPTHEKYPGSSIAKCNTPEASTTFDACKELASGESYSFVFNEAGEWPYHNHVDAATFGKVIVVG